MIRNIFIYLGILAIAVVPSFGAIVINEIRTAEPATDDEEFVELYDGGVTSSLVSLELRLINGANGAAFDTIALTSLGAMPGDGYLVVAGGALVPNTDLDDGPNTNFLQNGDPDGVILVDTGASPEVVLDAVSYFTTFSGAGVPNNGAMAADKYEGAGGTGAGGIDGTGTGGFIFNVQMGTAAPTTRTNTGFGRYPDGTDTDDNQTDIDNIFQLATPGTANGAGFLAGPITEDFSQATGLNREWSGAFTPVVLDDPASSEPASIGPSPDPITPPAAGTRRSSWTTSIKTTR
jgi:hypothetical protein